MALLSQKEVQLIRKTGRIACKNRDISDSTLNGTDPMLFTYCRFDIGMRFDNLTTIRQWKNFQQTLFSMNSRVKVLIRKVGSIYSNG